MALDQQSNWNISMAQSLAAAKRRNANSFDLDTLTGHDLYDQPLRPWTKVLHLPDEIILQILEFIARSPPAVAQKTLASCCLLSHQWYQAAVPYLYAKPHLYGSNFDPFVRSICPSINVNVRKSPLSALVKTLDMGALVHQGSKSLTARLLGRTKNNLEAFVAPQASFSIHSLPALSKCSRLRTLDLSLVSESPPLPDLFKTLAHLYDLRALRLPRSSGFGVHFNAKSTAFAWPPTLEDLTISGGLDAHFLHGIVAFPSTLRSLTIEHCPQAKGYAITHLMRHAIRPLPNLKSFTIRQMPRLGSSSLDEVLFTLPQINRLSVSVDYISPGFLDEGHYSHFAKQSFVVTANGVPTTPSPWEDTIQIDGVPAVESLRNHPLQYLELTSSGAGSADDKITPIDILMAITDDEQLPHLRQVRVAKILHWSSASTASDTEALADALQEAAKADWERRTGLVADDQTFQGRAPPWEREAGVWEFDG